MPGAVLALVLGLWPGLSNAGLAPGGPGEGRAQVPDFIVVPDATNAVQFRLYLDASPEALHLFNTFEVKAHGEILVPSPDADSFRRSLAARPNNAVLHNILLEGEGPLLAASNQVSVLERASGPEWRYSAVDLTSTYRGRLKEYRRGILFVEPDLFVLYDHIVAERPSRFQMILHPPAATQLDPIWKDLRLESTNAGIRIHAPGQRQDPRFWARMETNLDAILPGTVTMELGPTNKLSSLDLLTAFVIHKGGQKKELAFKLLQSNSSVGARIHREGLPTLVAFRLQPTEPKPSLTGFAFEGPVGVDVFKPKRSPAAK